MKKLLAALVVGAGVIVVAADPASAHGVGGVSPSNYKTEILSIEPVVDGISVEVVDLGDRLQLTNDTDQDVIVLGYDGEAYLRVGPDGVFENVNSPAVYLNRERIPSDPDVPPDADPDAPPDWNRIKGNNTVSWHDHRAHWMGNDDPEAVRANPDQQQVIQDWTVKLRQGDRTIAVRGDLLWVPGPSPWRWAFLAILLAAAVIVLSRTKWWAAVIAAALLLLVAAELVHVVGLWGATTRSGLSKLLASAYSIAGILLGAGTLAWMARRRDPVGATPAVLIAAIFLFVAGGLADLQTLARSQLPTTQPDWVARLCVTAALGLGAGLIVATLLRLRAAPAPAKPAPRRELEATPGRLPA
ncbi:MAG: hypothetical protein ACRDWD_01215 [Acidimicrobiia bacterium]